MVLKIFRQQFLKAFPSIEAHLRLLASFALGPLI
jgi:hypothetical protein